MLLSACAGQLGPAAIADHSQSVSQLSLVSLLSLPRAPPSQTTHLPKRPLAYTPQQVEMPQVNRSVKVDRLHITTPSHRSGQLARPERARPAWSAGGAGETVGQHQRLPRACNITRPCGCCQFTAQWGEGRGGVEPLEGGGAGAGAGGIELRLMGAVGPRGGAGAGGPGGGTARQGREEGSQRGKDRVRDESAEVGGCECECELTGLGW